MTRREWECRKISRIRAFRRVVNSYLLKTGLLTAALIAVMILVFGFWLDDSYPAKAMAGYFKETGHSIQRRMGLEVKEVIISGREKAAMEDIVRALGIKKGDPIFSIPAQDSKVAIEKLGWVREATISRKLPGIIQVDIKERKPVALWQSASQLYLIDKDGFIITDKHVEQYSDLPIVLGRNAPAKIYSMLRLLAAQRDLFNEISSLTLVGDRRWDVKLYNGVIIKLPEDECEAAWNYLAELDKGKDIFKRNILTIDLRLKDRVFIGLPEGALSPPQPKSGEST